MDQAVQLLWSFSCVALFDCSSCLCKPATEARFVHSEILFSFPGAGAQIQQAGEVGAVPAVD